MVDRKGNVVGGNPLSARLSISNSQTRLKTRDRQPVERKRVRHRASADLLRTTHPRWASIRSGRPPRAWAADRVHLRNATWSGH